MTLKVIPRLQAFSSAIRRTFVQYSTDSVLARSLSDSWASCLHFTLGIAKQNAYWPRPYVCVSVPRRIPTFMHGPVCNFEEWQGATISCAQLGRFVIGEWILLLWKHMHLMQNVSKCSCTRCMTGYNCCDVDKTTGCFRTIHFLREAIHNTEQ